MGDLGSLKAVLGQKMDVDSITDSEGTPIDEGIKPLVIILNHLGFQTVASCQGHSLMEHKNRLKKGEKVSKETPYSFVVEKKLGEMKIKVMFDQAPWVDVQATAEQKARLERLIMEYNKKSGVAWKLHDNFGLAEPSCRLSAHHEHPIETLYGQIDGLADFLNGKV